MATLKTQRAVVATRSYATPGMAAAGALPVFSARPIDGVGAGAAEVALLARVTRAMAAIPREPVGNGLSGNGLYGNGPLSNGPLSNGPGRLALVLHLSHLATPRAHHRRIARAILDDAVQRLQGELFALRNRDLVLILPPVLGVEVLSSQLARLFRIDQPTASALLSAWPAGGDEMLAYATARLQDPPAAERVEPIGRPAAVDETLALIGTARLTDLTQRQVGVAISGEAGSDEAVSGKAVSDKAGMPRLRPAYTEIMVALSVLRSRLAAVGQAEADPYLFRHLAGQLDGRMLLAVEKAVREGGAPPLPVHLNLTIGGVLSPGFERLAAGLATAGGSLAVELPLLEACGDPAGFARARDCLRAANVALVLDGVSHQALAITNLASLEPDWIKLDWSEGMAGHAPTLDGLARLGVHRVVLARVETAAAVAWGMRHGIPVFQGRHIDGLLAAARVGACPAAAGCVARQCQERATATGAAGRAGCTNPALLDAAAP